MKKIALLIIPVSCCLLSCNFFSGNPKRPNNSPLLPPGSVIAADSTPIADDQLNHTQFTVEVSTTDSLNTYDVEAGWGYNTAISTIKMPIGGEHFKPLLRKGDSSYSYIIGFHFDNDTIFHDYYEVTAQRGQIAMKYIRAYVME